MTVSSTIAHEVVFDPSFRRGQRRHERDHAVVPGRREA
jgi:hypothetical protein